MSDPNTLGGIVRRRRLESGYSLGQLASKVGKTAAEVRAWERDAELPEHGILDRLAETLELDVAQIRAKVTEAQEAAARQAADVEPQDSDAADEATPDEGEPEDLGPEEGETLDKSDDEDDSAAIAVVEPEESAEPAEPEAAATPEADTAADDEAAPEEDLPGFPVEDPFTPPEPLDDPEPDASLLDAPTEAVPVPVITETAKTARAQRAAAVLEEPPLPMVEPAPDADPGLLRYLEPLRLLFDPHSRYLYWIRAGLTIIVMLVLVVFLFRMLGSLLDAVAELLDTIEPATTDPDDLDAFGVGWRG
jgi:transcriptional regulator with XRE-family HTH domain